MKLRELFLGSVVLCAIVYAGCASHKANKIPEEPLAIIFNRAASIKLLSYANETYEAPLIEGQEPKSTAPIDTVLRVVADLRIPESMIKEEIKLSRPQRKALFNLLQTDMCEIDEVQSVTIRATRYYFMIQRINRSVTSRSASSARIIELPITFH